MTRTARTLYVEALDVLLRGRMADIAVARDWELLREVARLAQQDAQLALASTDPALFSSWRAAVTKYHLKGWTHMTPERVDAVRDRANSYTSPQDSFSTPPRPRLCRAVIGCAGLRGRRIARASGIACKGASKCT